MKVYVILLIAIAIPNFTARAQSVTKKIMKDKRLIVKVIDTCPIPKSPEYKELRLQETKNSRVNKYCQDVIYLKGIPDELIDSVNLILSDFISDFILDSESLIVREFKEKFTQRQSFQEETHKIETENKIIGDFVGLVRKMQKLKKILLPISAAGKKIPGSVFLDYWLRKPTDNIATSPIVLAAFCYIFRLPPSKFGPFDPLAELIKLRNDCTGRLWWEDFKRAHEYSDENFKLLEFIDQEIWNFHAKLCDIYNLFEANPWVLNEESLYNSFKESLLEKKIIGIKQEEKRIWRCVVKNMINTFIYFINKFPRKLICSTLSSTASYKYI
ncbi:hypothetical protein FACS1894113_0220 [Alphaproteobacteria bacterium]|nr:hypothetical protein FACS1894113_0220 [Alphaproteobacteria bacterium]